MILYYRQEDVEKFCHEHGIELKYGDLVEYWHPVIHINQAYATGPHNIIPTIYVNGVPVSNMK